MAPNFWSYMIHLEIDFLSLSVGLLSCVWQLDSYWALSWLPSYLPCHFHQNKESFSDILILLESNLCLKEVIVILQWSPHKCGNVDPYYLPQQQHSANSAWVQLCMTKILPWTVSIYPYRAEAKQCWWKKKNNEDFECFGGRSQLLFEIICMLISVIRYLFSVLYLKL